MAAVAEAAGELGGGGSLVVEVGEDQRLCGAERRPPGLR